MAYRGISGQQDFSLPYGDADMNDPVMDSVTHHRMPLTIGLSVQRPLFNGQWSIGTGLQYTRLLSETHKGNTYIWEEQKQRLQYLGIPLRLSWHPVVTPRWNVYAAAHAMVELPLRSTLDRNIFVEGRRIETEDLRLKPSVQWSMGLGVGLEYRLTPVIGLYAEPSVDYFFKTGDGLDSWRTAYPAAFSLPFGIRITIK